MILNCEASQLVSNKMFPRKWNKSSQGWEGLYLPSRTMGWFTLFAGIKWLKRNVGKWGQKYGEEMFSVLVILLTAVTTYLTVAI